MSTPLEDLIARRIRLEGPLPLPAYMALCLGHPEHGYYASRPSIGQDFVTAPELTSLFGEMIGLWALDFWQRMGAPSRIALVELGPGRGTLLADALRAAGRYDAFRRAVTVHLVEISPPLRAAQALALNSHAPVWHDSLANVPDGPMILIANEFFDALPVRHLIRDEAGWMERCVGLDARGKHVFVTRPSHASLVPAAFRDSPPGTVIETAPQAEALAADIGRRLHQDGGAALVIDYGHDAPRTGATLQALQDGRPADPLAAPGRADLTAHVDFCALGTAALQQGAIATPIVTQAGFLRQIGLPVRAAQLQGQPGADHLDAALHRLLDPTEMGTLFKVMAWHGRNDPTPAGFAP